MKNFGRKILAISLAEVILALVIMSLVILASKNITDNKLNYAKRVRAYSAWLNLSKISSAIVKDGVIIDNNYTYKMISPIFKSGTSGTYLPDVYNDVGQQAIRINGGFADGLVEYLNLLDTNIGPNFTCSGCNTRGYFNEENVTPTLTLSNGMTLFISPAAYSFAKENYSLTNLANDSYKNFLKCLNGGLVVDSSGNDCSPSTEIGYLCAPIEGKAAPVAPWSTTFSGNITTYFKNSAECPACANNGQTIKRYYAVQLFEQLHLLTKALGSNSICTTKSVNFLNDAFDRFLNGSYYIVYVDSDGPRSGSNTLNDDVLQFYVLLSGEVLPVSPIMKNGDYLLANLYAQTTAKTTLVTSGVPLPRAMCNKKVADNLYSYYSKNFRPIPEYCPYSSAEAAIECPNDALECYYKVLKTSVSIRGKSKRD